MASMPGKRQKTPEKPYSKRQKTTDISSKLGCDRKIIIAVDFGTTYSGLAWAQTRKPETQSPILQWPDATSGGLEGITSDKVPTEIQYNGDNYKWGFQISKFGTRHQWFKLHLDPSQLRGASVLVKYPPNSTLLATQLVMPEKLIEDYLTALRKHAEHVLVNKLAGGALLSTPLEYVITVPAMWSDGAQAKTRACAERAGMGRGPALQIISEPEAAAMYALDTMDPHGIQVGDTFVLCDAGGGTVDLISYTVSALKPILQIKEASPGSGSLCGSSFLNRIFEKFLMDKFASNPGWDEDVVEEASLALKRFETVIKRSFCGVETEEYYVPVPGLQDDSEKGVRRSRFVLTGFEVKAIFEPVITEVLSFVLGQIKATSKPVKAVLIVGSFGQSAYLRDRIRAAVGGVEVLQSPNRWTAVVRGALMKGLASASPASATVKISGRSARKHYGIHLDDIFDASKHQDQRKKWSAFDGRYRIEVMKWFVTKGSQVIEDEPFRLDFIMTFLVSLGHPSEFKINIFVFSDPRNEGAPLYHDVTNLTMVTADLREVPENLIPKDKGKDGKYYYKLDFQLEITYFSAHTRYELIYDNVNYGPVSAEYV